MAFLLRLSASTQRVMEEDSNDTFTILGISEAQKILSLILLLSIIYLKACKPTLEPMEQFME